MPLTLPALLILGAAGCRSCPPPDPDLFRPTPSVSRDWEAALRALEKNEFQVATPLLHTVTQGAPRFVKAHLLYQDAMIVLGNEKEVREEYRDRRSDSGLALALYARVAPEGRGIALLEQAVVREPENPWINYALGFERLSRSDRKGAHQHLERALCLDPDLPEARAAMARLCRIELDQDGEAAAYDAYLRISPLDALRWLKLAILRHGAGDANEAIEAYTKVLTINRDDFLKAIRRRDVILTEDQLRSFEGRCSVPYRARVNLSELYLEREGYPKVIAVLEEAVASDSRCPDAHFNLGIAYWKLSREVGKKRGSGAHQRRRADLIEKAVYHWTQYRELGGLQQERVRDWLNQVAIEDSDPFGGGKKEKK